MKSIEYLFWITHPTSYLSALSKRELILLVLSFFEKEMIIIIKNQVTIEAITDCTILQIDEESLEKAFDSAPHLRMVLDCLIGEKY